MSVIVEIRRDRFQQLWDHHADGSVWPHGTYRQADEGWRVLLRACRQREWQRERLRWAREVFA